jgi:hypothetical protein
MRHIRRFVHVPIGIGLILAFLAYQGLSGDFSRDFGDFVYSLQIAVLVGPVVSGIIILILWIIKKSLEDRAMGKVQGGN